MLGVSRDPKFVLRNKWTATLLIKIRDRNTFQHSYNIDKKNKTLIFLEDYQMWYHFIIYIILCSWKVTMVYFFVSINKFRKSISWKMLMTDALNQENSTEWFSLFFLEETLTLIFSLSFFPPCNNKMIFASHIGCLRNIWVTTLAGQRTGRSNLH